MHSIRQSISVIWNLTVLVLRLPKLYVRFYNYIWVSVGTVIVC